MRSSTLVLFFIAVTSQLVISDAVKTRTQPGSKRNAKPIPIKGKQIPIVKPQGKSVQSAAAVKLPNTKRWMPVKKNSVKYVPKIANNTKRWMPGFADMGQGDMESSMMYDTGFVSSDPPSSYAQQQQQPSNEYGLQPGTPQAEQQGIPPEQSFLSPSANDVGLNVERGDNQYQGVGNEIESFTKEGLDDTSAVTQMYNNFDFQDTVLNNPKFQEGDYIGTSLQENGNKANLYDAFSLEPGMAENFVNPTKEKGGGGAGKPGGGKNDKKEDNKDAKEEEKGKSEKEEKEDSKQAGKQGSKNEKSVNNGKVESSDDEKGLKAGKAKAVTGSQKEVEKSDDDDEKEANDKKGKEGKEKGKKEDDEKISDKEENEKKLSKNKSADDSEKESEEMKEKNTGKGEEGSEEKEALNMEKLVANANKGKAEKEENGKEEKGGKENDAEDVKEKENAADDERKEKNVKSQSKKIKNASFAKQKKLTKSSKESENEDEDTEKVKGNRNKAKLKMKNEEDSAQQEEDDAKNSIDKEVSNSKNEEAEQNADEDKNEEDNKEEDAARIKKLKQRINSQKMRNRGKLQQDAAARYKISSDVDMSSTLASNVAPANGALGIAAEGLRKQLVSNLRNALMKNVAAAMAKGKTVDAAGNSGPATQLTEFKQMNGKQETAGGNEAVTEAQGQQQQQQQQMNERQESNEKSSSYQQVKAQGESKMNENRDEGNEAKEDSDQSLVPTLMKMDKNMLVDTILKLLKKNKGASGQQTMMGSGEKDDKGDKENDQRGGALNQSFRNQEGGNVGKESKDQNPETKESGLKDESTDGRNENGKTEEVKGPKNAAQEEENSGHAEYSMYPVKSEGSTKYYKFKKLQGQGHIKGSLAHLTSTAEDDPYAQIGLADPSNNDKITAHHKSSNLKEDTTKEETKTSKFTKSKQDQESPNQETSNQEPLNQESSNQESSNQESSNQETGAKQSQLNQRSDQNTDEDQQSNDNTEQSTDGSQQSMNQQSPDQAGNQESTKIQKTEKDSPIQQSTLTEQDGVTTETNINADSPKMVAQLLKISQRLHEINNKKAQNEQKESSNNQQVVNSNNNSNNVAAQRPRDDAYSTIGSFDPNVKKKAAIGQKKSIRGRLQNKDERNLIRNRS